MVYLIIQLITANVKPFSGNKLFISLCTLPIDKFLIVWYNGKFGRSRSWAARQKSRRIISPTLSWLQINYIASAWGLGRNYLRWYRTKRGSPTEEIQHIHLKETFSFFITPFLCSYYNTCGRESQEFFTNSCFLLRKTLLCFFLQYPWQMRFLSAWRSSN